MRGLILIATLTAAALWMPLGHAQEAPPKPQACVGITSDALRLACYDRAMEHQSATSNDEAENGHEPARAPTRPQAAQVPRRSLFNHESRSRRSKQHSASAANHHGASASSLLDSRWELSRDSKLGTFNIRGYKPVYVLPVFYTTNVNQTPHSSAPGHTITKSQRLERLEALFQISFKTKIVQGMIAGYGDLWFGYTQTSHWQVYNSAISRPFRETNYQPEALLVFNTDYHLLGWTGRLAGIGINHQSNGRSDPFSRSWNRIIANIGFDRPGWTVMFRPWVRIHESRSRDDNPDIADYMGRGSVQIVHEVGDNEFSLMLRHSLRRGSRSHGAARFTWAFPIHAKLRGYVQLFHGYGESLIDYNHNATYVGVGVSLLGWY